MEGVRQTLERHLGRVRPPGLVAAWLFGSHARGAAHRESDIDVGVVLDRDRFPDRRARFDEAVRLASDLIAATHHNEVQVVVLTDVSPELAAAAVTDGVRVYGSDGEEESRTVAQILSRHADLRPWLERMRRIKLEALST